MCWKKRGFTVMLLVIPVCFWASAQSATQPVAQTWLRCFIRVPPQLAVPANPDLERDSITFNVSAVREPFSVYLNGQKIAQSDPIVEGPRQRFKVPKGILQKDVFNVLAIRMDSDVDAGALGEPPILADYHDELRLDGAWEIMHGQIEASALKPVAQQPEKAFYIESGFRPASS